MPSPVAKPEGLVVPGSKIAETKRCTSMLLLVGFFKNQFVNGFDRFISCNVGIEKFIKRESFY